jgi:hypothetical protein
LLSSEREVEIEEGSRERLVKNKMEASGLSIPSSPNTSRTFSNLSSKKSVYVLNRVFTSNRVGGGERRGRQRKLSEKKFASHQRTGLFKLSFLSNCLLW